MNQLQEKTIGEYVAENFRTAAVFKKYGINFCCKGGRTIEETCRMKDLDPAPIYEDLKNTSQGTAEENDFNNWSLTDLADYIKEVHHEYIQEKSIYLLQFLDKLCRVHGERHPELFKINELFTLSSQNLIVHLRDVEEKLFPYIREKEQNSETAFGGDLQAYIEKLQAVYQTEKERLRRLREFRMISRLPKVPALHTELHSRCSMSLMNIYNSTFILKTTSFFQNFLNYNKKRL